MATGRTLPAFHRIYLDGYDMNRYVVDTGGQGIECTIAEKAALSDGCVGSLPSKTTVSCGPINGIFDNTATSGLHVVASAAQGVKRNVMVVYGIQGEPAVGDYLFAAPMITNYFATNDAGAIKPALLNFPALDQASNMAYRQFFGRLLHTWSAASAANSSNTPNVDDGAATTAGGWLMWMISSITGSGTATVSVDDSANGTAWLALSGATSGAIATATAPTSGIVQLATDATVRRYLRWQIAFGGSATAATFILAFIRGK